MADIITQAEPEVFNKNILDHEPRARASFERLPYYVMNDALVGSLGTTRPDQSDPLLFTGFIIKKGNNEYYRVRKTPIPSEYLCTKMDKEEIRDSVPKEVVLTSHKAIDRIFEYLELVTSTTPARLRQNKRLEEIFNNQEAYDNYMQKIHHSSRSKNCDETIR